MAQYDDDDDEIYDLPADAKTGGFIVAGRSDKALKQRGSHIAGAVASGIAAFVVSMLPSWPVPFLLPVFGTIAWAWVVHFAAQGVGHAMLAGYNSPQNTTIAKLADQSTAALAMGLMAWHFPLDLAAIPGLPGFVPLLIRAVFALVTVGNGIGSIITLIRIFTGKWIKPETAKKYRSRKELRTDTEEEE